MRIEKMISNTPDLLEDIYHRQVKKFGETTEKILLKRLDEEIYEYQEALRNNFMNDNQQSRLEVMLEQADIIILANRLYQEFNNMLAWLILDKMYNFESAKYVKMKWDIVENRPYSRDKNGFWQHRKGKL